MPPQRHFRKKEKLAQIAAHLKGIDPKNLLAKGFCILFDEAGTLIQSTGNFKPQDKVQLQLHDGKARLTVDEIFAQKKTLI
jgi:exonuclease VII large subunit